MVKCIILYSICILVLSHVSHITITLQDILAVKLELDKGETGFLFFFQNFLMISADSANKIVSSAYNITNILDKFQVQFLTRL
jgi:hypothetical protein